MKQGYTKRFLAFVLTLALVLTGSSVSTLLFGAVAEAAPKATLKLKKSKVSLQEGKTTTLKISKKNVKKIKSQKWSSTKKKVATVSKKGKVTAKKAGKATITVKVKYIAKGSKKVNSKTLKAKVTVTAKGAKQTAAPGVTVAATAPTTTVAPTATAPTAAPTASVMPTAPGKPLVTVPSPFKYQWNDTSNIGEEREVSIEGASTMKVKDNGSMRKDLTTQYLAEKEMGAAINLGNTMEATVNMAKKMADAAKEFEGVSTVDYETSWGMAVTTQEYIDCLHSYGINTIRIPVAWTNMIYEDGSYKISDKLLGRVEEIVNYALNDGMYVIINDHWDNQWWGQFGACKQVPKLDEDGNPVLDKKGNPKYDKVPNEEVRAQAWVRYEAYWTQIAERFAGYSDHLIFEGANEELGDRLTDAICSNGYATSADPNDSAIGGKLTAAEKYDITNRINQLFVDTVRKSGEKEDAEGNKGNNYYRCLLIPGYNTDMSKTEDERYLMPTDVEENGKNRLFLSVHYYTPWDFCGDDGTGDYTDDDLQATKDYFTMLKKFYDEGYGIIIGEAGVCNPRKVDISSRTIVDWFRDTMQIGYQYNAVICFWETGQYFDRAAAKIKFRDIAQLFNEVTGANGEITGGLTGLQNNASSIMDVEGKTPVWSWTGKWYKNGGDNVVGDDRHQEGGGTKVTITGNETDDEIRAQFVPESKVESTIDGDATELTFDTTGFQAFLKLDLSKYKKPAIAFTFSDAITDANAADEVGYVQLGPNDKQGFAEVLGVDYDKFIGKAIVLEDELMPTAGKPYLSISFSMKPTVTGIYIYETATE